MAKQRATKEKISQKSEVKTAAQPNIQNLPFVFDKVNYAIMITGIIVIVIGFMLMSGGATKDPNIFPADEIYSFRRITLAPIVVLIGFGIEIVAILRKPVRA